MSLGEQFLSLCSTLAPDDAFSAPPQPQAPPPQQKAPPPPKQPTYHRDDVTPIQSSNPQSNRQGPPPPRQRPQFRTTVRQRPQQGGQFRPQRPGIRPPGPGAGIRPVRKITGQQVMSVRVQNRRPVGPGGQGDKTQVKQVQRVPPGSGPGSLRNR